jgi:hypothetical protein
MVLGMAWLHHGAEKNTQWGSYFFSKWEAPASMGQLFY